MRPHVRVLSGIAALLAIAATLISTTSTANAATKTTTAQAATSSTCAGSGTNGMQTATLTVAGKQRTYAIYVPPSWTGSKKVPVVYDFQGRYGQAIDQLWASQFWKDSDKYGFIAVAPQAVGDPIDWDTHSGTDVPTSDANFILQLQTEVAKKWCVDTSRQYAAGYSSGSIVTQALACYGLGNFKGLAGSAETTYNGGCPNKAGFTYTYFHGTADPYAPFWGNSELPSVQWSMYQLAKDDGCSTVDPNQITQATSTVDKYSWTSCTGGNRVDVFVMNGAGHIWPGSDYIASLGPQPANFYAADVLTSIWGLDK